MSTDSNSMKLTQWNSPTDTFNYQQLSTNFGIIAEHNHDPLSAGGVQIGNGGIANGAINNDKLDVDAVNTNNILNEAITTDKILDSNVTYGKIEKTASTRLSKTSATVLQTGTGLPVWTQILFDTEDWSTDSTNMSDTTNHVIKPTRAGFYALSMKFEWNFGTNVKSMMIKSGSTVIAENHTGNCTTSAYTGIDNTHRLRTTLSTLHYIAAGDLATSSFSGWGAWSSSSNDVGIQDNWLSATWLGNYS
jgi:hypothetical protein